MKNKFKSLFCSLLLPLCASFLLLAPLKGSANSINLSAQSLENKTQREEIYHLEILPFSLTEDLLVGDNYVKEFITSDSKINVKITLSNLKYVAPSATNNGYYEFLNFFNQPPKSNFKINLDKNYTLIDTTVSLKDETTSIACSLRDNSISSSKTYKLTGTKTLYYNFNHTFYDEMSVYCYTQAIHPCIEKITLNYRLKPVDSKLDNTKFTLGKENTKQVEFKHHPSISSNEVLTLDVALYDTKNHLLASGSKIKYLSGTKYSFSLVLPSEKLIGLFVFKMTSNISDSLNNFTSTLLVGIGVDCLSLLKPWGNDCLLMSSYDKGKNEGVMGPGECISKGYYANAKNALHTLDDANPGIALYLKINPDDNTKYIGAFKARYEAWAKANNDYDPYDFLSPLNSLNSPVIHEDSLLIVASILTILLIGGSTLLVIRKHKKEA